MLLLRGKHITSFILHGEQEDIIPQFADHKIDEILTNDCDFET